MFFGLLFCYHFRDNKDRDNFLDRLGNVLYDTGTPCYAWALIPNHAHLLLKTGNTPISTIMQRALTGGGLIRSFGGWSMAKLLRRSIERIKSDERILNN